MKNSAEQFECIRRVHSRLHIPEVTESSVWLVPLDMDVTTEMLAISDRQSSEQSGTDKRWSVRRMILKHDYFGGVVVHALQASIVKGSVLSSTDIDEVTDGNTPLSSHLDGLHRLDDSSKQSLLYDAISTVKDEPTHLKINPVRSTSTIDLITSCSFTMVTPVGKSVKLFWKALDDQRFQCVEMGHEGSGVYRTAIATGFGNHLFAYAIDGVVIPPCSHGQRLQLLREGVFAYQEQRQPSLIFCLTNESENRESVSLFTEDKWLVSRAVVLRPQETRYVTLPILPSHLNSGLNKATVRVLLRHDSQVKTAGTFTVEVEGVGRGAWADLSCEEVTPAHLGATGGELKFRLTVAGRGKGPLSGTLLFPQLGDHVDFRFAEVSTGSVFNHDLAVAPQRLMRETGVFKIVLVTDSYLANRRVLQMQVPYRAIILKKSLPVLLFGSIPQGSVKTLRFSAQRSDGRELNLVPAIPGHASHYLTVARNNTNAFSFRLDATKLQPGTSINDTIMLTDAASGLQDTIKVIAQVLGA